MSKRDEEFEPSYEPIRKFQSKRLRKAGRWEDPTPEITQQFCDCIVLGNFRYIARGSCGITQNEYAAWARRRKKAEREERFDDPCYLFFAAVEEAEAQLHGSIVQDVLVTGDARDKLKFLTHRWNKLYSNNPNAHIDDESGQEVEYNPNQILQDAMKDLVDAANGTTTEDTEDS